MNRIHSILIAVFVTVSFLTHAQTLDWDWVNDGGGNSKSVGKATCTDSEGNIYVVGNFVKSITFGSVTINAQDTSSYSLFVVKYDADHTVQWAYGGQTGQAFAVNATNDGAVYITGCHNGSTTFGTTTFTTAWGCSAFVLKLDSSGNQLWVKNIHTQPGQYDGYQFGRAIVTDANGNVYVGGDFSGNTLLIDSLSIENPNVGCFGDIWFVRFTPSGTLTWAKRMGGYGADEVTGLSVDNSGNVYMTGNTYCSGVAIFDTITHLASDERFFTAKFAPSGSIQWARFGGNTYLDAVNAICTDASGNTYITGTAMFSPAQDFGNGVSISGKGFKDHFIVKYDHSGNAVWGKSIGGENEDQGTGLCVDHWGNICVSGYTQGPELVIENDTLPVTGALLYVARYDDNGTLAFLHTAKPTFNCLFLQPFGVVSDISGNLYVTGNYNTDTAQFNNQELTKHNGCDPEYFLARLGIAQSTLSIETSQPDLLQLYPNPVKSALHLNLSEKATVEILSLAGESITTVEPVTKEFTIDVSDLQSGLYLIHVSSSKGNIVRQFVKE